MASDKSEPKIGNIVKVAVISVVTLLGVRCGLTTYFHSMEDGIRAEYATEAKKRQQAAPGDDAFNARIKDSMSLLVSRGRKDLGIEVAPQQPKEMEKPCWQALPCDYGDAGPAPTSAATDAGAGATHDDHGLLDGAVPLATDAAVVETADAAAMVAADAGAVKTAADAAAPKQLPAGDAGRAPPGPRHP